MASAIDMGKYFRIPADSRDLNYDNYFNKGRDIAGTVCEYNSENTEQLDVEGMKKLLLKLPVIREEFGV